MFKYTRIVAVVFFFIAITVEAKGNPCYDSDNNCKMEKEIKIRSDCRSAKRTELSIASLRSNARHILLFNGLKVIEIRE